MSVPEHLVPGRVMQSENPSRLVAVSEQFEGLDHFHLESSCFHFRTY